MSRFNKIFKNTRVIIALIFIVLALWTIWPNPWATGVAIRSVDKDSPAYIENIENPDPTHAVMTRERIVSINGVSIETMEDYNEALASLKLNQTVYIKTKKLNVYLPIFSATNNYVLVAEPVVVETNETIEKNITEIVFDEETNETEEVIKTIEETKKIELDEAYLGLNVYQAPTSNIRKGIDLEGGTRVLLKPEEKLSADDFSLLINNLKYRLNVYGLSDISVRKASDLSGNNYVMVEIAGAKEEEAVELLKRQGKFEAKIGNKTVFRGGDITYVSRGDRAGVFCPSDTLCTFRFGITLSPEAAERHAAVTEDLSVITVGEKQYLSEKLILYLDDEQVNELNIGAELKGRATTDIEISGPGTGRDEREAFLAAQQEMTTMQTILTTGSLKVKLTKESAMTLSPIFGPEMLSNTLLVGLLAIAAVGVVIFVRYRKFQIAVPMVFTMIIEVVLLLGFAAFIKWQIDFAAIAGIIIAVGTSVDHQIVITDEILRGEVQAYDWKKRIKSAFFIIMVAWLTTMVAMLPLLFAGAGLLKGFAITTMAGISIGIFISRPAYAAIIEILLKK